MHRTVKSYEKLRFCRPVISTLGVIERECRCRLAHPEYDYYGRGWPKLDMRGSPPW